MKSQRLKACLHTFERREEVPIELFPIMYGQFKKIPTDVKTLSKHCKAMDEFITCLGENFTYYCIQSDSNPGLTLLEGDNFLFGITLIVERKLCPNNENGVAIEDFSCLLKILSVMDTDHYHCRNMGKAAYNQQIPRETQRQIMLCHVLAANEKCGKSISQTLCKIYASGIIRPYIGLSEFSPYNCDDLSHYQCQCVSYYKLIHRL